MTPTTPATKIMDIVDEYGNAEHRQDDGQAVYFRNLIASEFDALTKERDELRLQIDIQAGSIEAVQAANQRLAANHKECVKCLGEALQDRADLAEAAKLALEALERLHEYASEEWHATPKLVNACRTASLQIAEISKAGVQ